jgi:hypothetical protein
MKSTILKGAFLIVTMVGCEAEAPAITREAREDLKRVATRAERALEESGDAAEAPACRRAERVIYACDFGDRRVAVCAAEDRLSYRFGTDRRTDLEIDSRPGRLRAFVGGVVGGGNGHQNRIRFSNNDYNYIVHSMVAGDATDAPGARSSGVTVVHGSGVNAPIVRTLKCPQDTSAQIIPGNDALPKVTFDEDGEAWDAWW